MDEFINSIKSQTINLDNLDSACTLFNIPFLFWYKNAKRSSWDHFMPPSILKSAFFKALMDFPLLAGYIKTDSTGSSCIEIDSGNLNMPEYTDTDCDVDFETLQDSGYNTKMLSSIFADKCISPAPPGLYGGFIKMITANVLRLKDYSGVVLFIGIAHCAVDGYGYCGFINRWAEIAKWMQHSSTVGLLIPERTFIHDRSIHYTGTYSHCDKLENSVQKVMTSGSFLSRWIAWISPESQGRLFKGMSILANCKGLYFHITADVLKTLRESVKKCAAPNASQYSDNDILSALIVMTIGQSMRKIADEKQNKAVAKAFSSLFGIKSGSAEDIMTMVAVDMRPRLNCCGVMDFMGNLAFSRNITTLQDTLQMENTYESLAMIASSIRQIVDSTSKEYGLHSVRNNSDIHSDGKPARDYVDNEAYPQLTSGLDSLATQKFDLIAWKCK
ncbi:hypothetical protein GGI26_005756 [Coemansia sp. RSA 1358]|nr:hypothetical protein GGI26_005756 [Coemansia sp. RSA 1358]